MKELSNLSSFQIGLMLVFATAVLVAVFMFASGTFLGGAQPVAHVEIWGTIERNFAREWIGAAAIDEDRIEVEYRFISPERFTDELNRAARQNTLPDVIVAPTHEIYSNSDIVFPVPFSTFSLREFRDTFIEAGEIFVDTRAGEIYAYPVLIDPVVMYWNRSLLAQGGFTRPPDLWEDLPSFASSMTRITDESIQQSAVALGTYENIEHAKEILSTLVFQAGGEIIRGNGPLRLEAQIDNDQGLPIEPAVTALLYYTDFADPRRGEYSWNSDLPNSLELFTAGDLAVYFGLASDQERIRDRNPNLNFDVGEVPFGRDGGLRVVHGNVVGISLVSGAGDMGAAHSVMLSLTSSGALSGLSESLGFLPPARSDLVANSPQNPFFAPVFYQSAVRSRSWIDPDPNEIDVLLRDLTQSVLEDSEDSARHVRRANGRLRVIIRGDI